MTRHRTIIAMAASTVALSALPGSGSAAPVCAPDPRVAPLASQWLRKTAIQPIAPLDTAQARCFKQAFVKTIAPHFGKPAGVKVGLYSQAARAAYQTATPRLGYLFEGMLLPSGATVPVDFAIGGTWESDLLLVVGDDKINTAQTREQLYDGLRGFRPFIELPDRNFPPGVTVNADQVEAINTGARLGVMGAEVALPRTAQAMNGLVNFSVNVTTSGAGETKVETGKALNSLGDVIEILRFARDQVLAEGGRLKPGDLVSIGVVTPARAPVANQTLTIGYDIVPATSIVSVNFR